MGIDVDKLNSVMAAYLDVDAAVIVCQRRLTQLLETRAKIAGELATQVKEHGVEELLVVQPDTLEIFKVRASGALPVTRVSPSAVIIGANSAGKGTGL
jgi:hypothetical protein